MRSGAIIFGWPSVAPLKTKNAGIAAGAKRKPVALCQWFQNAASEIIPMMAAITNPISIG